MTGWQLNVTVDGLGVLRGWDAIRVEPDLFGNGELPPDLLHYQCRNRYTSEPIPSVTSRLLLDIEVRSETHADAVVRGIGAETILRFLIDLTLTHSYTIDAPRLARDLRRQWCQHLIRRAAYAPA